MTLAVVGFAAVFVLAWNHGKVGQQATTLPERPLLGAVAAAWLAASILVWLRADRA